MLMLRTSFRSLLRNRRRSIASALAIGFGCIAILLSTGFVEWIYDAIREGAIQTGLGHVQIARPGYWTEAATDPERFVVPGVPSQVETLARDSRVKAIAPRLQFNGLAVVGDTSVPFLALGIDPAVEENISHELKTVTGAKLSGISGSEALLGRGLATALGVKLGDTVVLIISTQAGGVNAAEVVVRGTFTTDVKAIDDIALRVPIDLARKLTRMNGTHMWAVALKNTSATDAFAADTARALAGSGLDYRPWSALADFYNKTRELFSSQMNFVVLIIGAIVVLVISNLMIMNVLERTGEIGTMLALGTPRRQVLRGFLMEGLIMGLCASALGIVVGVALAALISHVGIPMPPPPGWDTGYSGEILLTSGGVALAFVVGVVAATLASVYPAWTASKLQIVDALRHNR
jgi:putative ABC transport system permease protein